MKFVSIIIALIATSFSTLSYTNDPNTNKYRLLYDPVASLPIEHSTRIYYNPQGAPSWATIAVFEWQLDKQISKWKEKCGVRIRYGGLTSVQPGYDDGIFVIGWEPNDFFVWAYVEGYAEPTSDPYEWDIIDADMFLDPTAFTWTDLDDLLLHELGHMIGINHSEHEGVVMSGPPFSTYTNQEDLQDDDIRACRYLYGRQRN